MLLVEYLDDSKDILHFMGTVEGLAEACAAVRSVGLTNGKHPTLLRDMPTIAVGLVTCIYLLYPLAIQFSV
jgi:hypothetical protein